MQHVELGHCHALHEPPQHGRRLEVARGVDEQLAVLEARRVGDGERQARQAVRAAVLKREGDQLRERRERVQQAKHRARRDLNHRSFGVTPADFESVRLVDTALQLGVRVRHARAQLNDRAGRARIELRLVREGVCVEALDGKLRVARWRIERGAQSVAYGVNSRAGDNVSRVRPELELHRTRHAPEQQQHQATDTGHPPT